MVITAYPSTCLSGFSQILFPAEQTIVENAIASLELINIHTPTEYTSNLIGGLQATLQRSTDYNGRNGSSDKSVGLALALGLVGKVEASRAISRIETPPLSAVSTLMAAGAAISAGYVSLPAISLNLSKISFDPRTGMTSVNLPISLLNSAQTVLDRDSPISGSVLLRHSFDKSVSYELAIEIIDHSQSVQITAAPKGQGIQPFDSERAYGMIVGLLYCLGQLESTHLSANQNAHHPTGEESDLSTAAPIVQHMSSCRIYQVDAFTDAVFGGNPAAVVALKRWLSDETLQEIARENNLPETAFFVREGEIFRLRWFTPTREVELCGHGTLATAHVLFNVLHSPEKELVFDTKSGRLVVRKNGAVLIMDFPAILSYPMAMEATKSLFPTVKPVELLRSRQDLLAVLPSEDDVKSYLPTWQAVTYEGHRGLIITARGQDVDFVSRCFYPEGDIIDEDPVTGSAHCQMAPYWSKKLGKATLKARQISKRGGIVDCEIKGNRVFLTGSAVLYLSGNILY